MKRNSDSRRAGFRILDNRAKSREQMKSMKVDNKTEVIDSGMIDEADESKMELADIRTDGSLVNIKTTTGKSELGMVLKYVDHETLATQLNPEFYENVKDEEAFQKDYAILGTYKYAELKQKVEENSVERPTLTLIVIEVVGDHQYRIIDMDEYKDYQIIVTALREIANNDPHINDRCNELLKTAVVSCISGGMSETYHANMKKIEEGLHKTPPVYETTAVDVDKTE